MQKSMERKIGEEFYCKGKTFKAVEVSFCLCEGCDLGGIENCTQLFNTIGNCVDLFREDGKNVIFKEVK